MKNILKVITQPLPTRTKRRQKELPGWKKVSGFERAFQREELISQKTCQIWREIHFTKCGKICLPRTHWSNFSSSHLYSNQDQSNPHFMVLNKEMQFLGVILLTGYHSLPKEHH